MGGPRGGKESGGLGLRTGSKCWALLVAGAGLSPAPSSVQSFSSGGGEEGHADVLRILKDIMSSW